MGKKSRSKKSCAVFESKKQKTTQHLAEPDLTKLQTKPPKRPDMIPFKAEKKIEESGRTYFKSPGEVLRELRSKKVEARVQPQVQVSAPRLPSFPKLEFAEARGLGNLQKNVEELLGQSRRGHIESGCHLDNYEEALDKRVREMEFDVEYEYEQELQAQNLQFRRQLAEYFEKVGRID